MSARDGETFRVIGASAGTGKTYRLTSLVLDALRPEGDTPALPPEALVGVTFTRKAAAELALRLRTRLHAAGDPDTAQRLGMAYLGTVHAVGLRLLGEFAVEAGLSTEVGVLPEDGGEFLHALVERVLSEERQRSLDKLARRLNIGWDIWQSRVNWHPFLFNIVDAARANRISPEQLPEMAARSWQTLRAHFDPPDTTRDLDAELLAALDSAVRTIDPSRDTTKKTKDFLATLATRRRHVVEGVWDPWPHFAGAELGKASRAEETLICAAGARYLAHPRLHADLERYLREIFAAAAEVLAAFAEWKAAAHVVDHTDQLDLAWRVLGRPEVADELRGQLGLVVVDELQDSSPLQLALFTRLHGLAGRSAWVGDPKQCIFEWSGADPALVDVVLAEVRARSGPAEQLTTNRRSRPELVQLTSELFASAFSDHGIDPASVRATPFRVDSSELEALPPLGLAFFPAADPLGVVLAEVVASLLQDARATPVLDRVTKQVRSVAAGDIAVLIATNDDCRDVADALARLGIRAATAREGLLETLEGRAVRAGLTLLVAPDDALAEAELEALLAREGDEAAVIAARERWLVQRLEAVRTAQHYQPGVWSQVLAPVRRQLAALSPGAALERLYEVLDLPRRVLGWPDAAQRLSNLDALRGLVTRYEALEVARERPLTLSGLLRALAAVAAEDKEMPLRDDQHVTEGADAVQVMTYHKAKGLEWPVVVMGGLDRQSRRSAFEVACESDAASFSLDDPLASRWVRYWPWPFVPNRTGELAVRVAQGPVGQAVSERERRERVRLLYVGFTRARDHLVLAIPENPKGGRMTKWLDELANGGSVVWQWTADRAHEFSFRTVTGESIAMRTRRVGRAQPSVKAAPALAFVRSGPIERARREVSPSRADGDDLKRFEATLRTPRGPVVALGEPLTVTTPSGFREWDRIGTTLHGFLASDRAHATVAGAEDQRLARAAHWLMAHDTSVHMRGEVLLSAADRLSAFVDERWPDAHWHCEVPIVCDVLDGDQRRRIRGTIDLLLETDAGWVLIDHKSFPAREGAWKKAAELAPQLALYAHALAQLPGARPVRAVWLHFPIAGVAVELA